jgi:hypothetical protein
MSERDESYVSNRSLLANASVDDIEDAFEKELLIKHHAIYEQALQQQEKFREVQELLRKMPEEINACYPDLKNQLQETAREITSEENFLDHQLMALEQNWVLQKVLEREKAKLREESNQRGKEALRALMEKDEATVQEIMSLHQEQRQKALKNIEQTSEPVSEPVTETVEPKNHCINSIKEKLFNVLGTFGIVLFYIVRCIIAVLPFVMIDGNFFVTLLLIAISMFIPLTSPIFWIWGLVCAIQGFQDFWAILYYITFALMWLPFFINLLFSVFSKSK